MINQSIAKLNTRWMKGFHHRARWPSVLQIPSQVGWLTSPRHCARCFWTPRPRHQPSQYNLNKLTQCSSPSWPRNIDPLGWIIGGRGSIGIFQRPPSVCGCQDYGYMFQHDRVPRGGIQVHPGIHRLCRTPLSVFQMDIRLEAP